MTTVAECARAIRVELKEKFPEMKFSVRSSNFSMGDDVNVSYENGIPEKAIELVLNKYKDGNFDGMEDIYNYRSNPDNLPRTKYLFVSRKVSPEIRESIKLEIADKFGIKNPNDEQEWYKVFNSWSDQQVWRELSERTV